MSIWLILAFIFAALEALAVGREWGRLEYLAKPAVMLCLFAWLYTATGLQGMALWFGVGLLFSLAGDIFLMISLDRLFLPGLISFLLAHLAYIAGFKDQIQAASGASLFLLAILAVSAVRVIRRIAGALRARGQDRLVVPISVYSGVISIMLFAAMSTIFDPAWNTGASFLVSLGAFLFYLSDVILAWNRFVSPIAHGRLLNILTYHLGQIGLIAGVISQTG
jgi:uncharacterized membrane protein YhhN